jgi:hypothetical protein
MSETTLPKSKRKTAADDKAVLADLLVEMDRLEAQMDQSHAESERLKTEAEIIKAETEIIKARTATTLSQLMQQIDILTQATN